MDNAALLAGALGLSATAFPVIMFLFAKNIAKDMQLLKNEIRKECQMDNDKMKESLEAKIDIVVQTINHQKLSVSNLDKISVRLHQILVAQNPNNKNIYEDFAD